MAPAPFAVGDKVRYTGPTFTMCGVEVIQGEVGECIEVVRPTREGAKHEYSDVRFPSGWSASLKTESLPFDPFVAHEK